MERYAFSTSFWVNKNENIQSNKFSQPIGPYIIYFSELLKEIYFLKLYVLRPNHICLFEFSNNSSRTKYEICSKWTIETTDMALVLVYLNIFKLNKLKYIWHFSSFFTEFEHVNAGWILYFDGYPFLLLEGLNLLPNFEKGGGSGSTKTQVLEGGCWERGWGGGGDDIFQVGRWGCNF